MSNTVITESTITCPECGFQVKEEMPVDACQFFWECPECAVVSKPQKEDCCVYCSYGDVDCPPVQEGTDCCS